MRQITGALNFCASIKLYLGWISELKYHYFGNIRDAKVI